MGTPLDRRERLVVGWFGPKGFASVVFALLILQANVPSARHLFSLAALVIAGSIVLHSSKDSLIARTFHDGGESSPRP